ncbi:MAG: hypothetical protein HYR55_11375 [Acidobacteria bacterium]|nr:hypothetical protein [Acidobacteriota bacterium]MBI3655064.1 hypothetical protein [Acidobacteriota bacterium]
MSNPHPQIEPWLERGQSYTTMATQVFVEELRADGRPRVLDLGCLCDTNIHFLTELGCHVFVDDVLQLNTQIPKGSHATAAKDVSQFISEHDYSPNFFDGILCWNLYDHLEVEAAQRLSHIIWSLLRITGCALALLRPEGSTASNVLRYRILNRGELLYETLPLPPLQGKAYQSRDIAGLVAPLALSNSYRLKNGWREVILRK